MNKDPFACSFCGKNRKEVVLVIAGPLVYICDDCVELCVEIIKEKKKKIEEPYKG